MKRITTASLLVLALSSSAAASASQATPVPGGATQASGVVGTFGQKLFNGEVRLVPKELRDPKASENLTAAAGQKYIVFTASASNGTSHALDMTQFQASIVSADGDTVAANSSKPTGGVYGIVPGGQWKEEIYFIVSSDFVPAKIVILPYDQKHKAFRITVRPTDYKHS